MGRYYWNAKYTVEDCKKITIFNLKKWNMLIGHYPGTITWTSSATGKESSIRLTVNIGSNPPYAKFAYTITDLEGNKTDYDYKVYLGTTSCYLGGVRYWFYCRFCSRRVGALYLAPSEGYFACRHCCDLSYESRNKSHHGFVGVMVYLMNLEEKIDKLYKSIKRWTYRGRPTKKVRRLRALEEILDYISF